MNAAITLHSLSHRIVRALTVALVAIGAFAALPQTAHAQQILALVNGEPITALDVEQRSKLITLSQHTNPSRKDVLEELINEKVKIREAKRYTLDITSKDVDSAYENMAGRMRMSGAQLNSTLSHNGIRPETMKQRLRAELTWTQLVRGRFQQSLQVSEQELRAATGGGGEATGNEYRLLPVVLIVPRGSSPGIYAERKKEAETLRGRIQGCDQINQFFRTMRTAAVRDRVTKVSADLPEALRNILDKLAIGQMTEPEITQSGVEMYALCERKPSTGDSPAQRAAREKLFAEKFIAKSNAYLQEARKSMMIEYK